MLRLGGMKSPFSPEYRNMVAAAKEVQVVRMHDLVFQSGDYVIFESAYTPAGMVSMIDEHSGGIVQDHAQVWLPQLHQLMELFGDYSASLSAMRSGLSGAGAPAGYFESFHSWEECTLAVLMLSRAGKVWNGKAWTPLAGRG
ncbi:MAG TPA: hypothetical protein VK465_06590 [Fibrobacteria bacterium]|nr:hypothetical protein [Fibrobacteria bacterium]